MRRLRILTWHVHGSYLYYLTQAPHEFYLPSKPSRSGGYAGKWGHIPWGDNVHDVPAGEVRKLPLDAILFQRRDHYLNDQHEILTEEQRRLPRLYLEHDPPQEHPTATPHFVDDPSVLLVHVTPFNALMWDNGRTPTRVIEHGVFVPPVPPYSGERDKGIAVVNHLRRRGRRLGADIFEQVRRHIPLDLVGLAAEESGGLGEVRHDRLPEFLSHYRFFFNPIRYTSLGLAVIEAMMCGLPVVGLATTEMATAVENGVSGYVDTRVERLIDRMNELRRDRLLARRLGESARRRAEERFNIRRFVRDWNEAFGWATGGRAAAPSMPREAAGIAPC